MWPNLLSEYFQKKGTLFCYGMIPLNARRLSVILVDIREIELICIISN